MEEIQNNIENDLKKVFTERQISLGTFLGGPLAAGILVSKNFKTFEDNENAKRAIWGGIILSLLIALFLYFAPNELIDKTPTIVFPTIYTLLVLLVTRNFQKDKIENFIKNNGVKESYWKTIGISLLSMIPLILLILLVTINKPIYDGKVKTFGKVENQIFYDDGISEQDVQKIGQALTEAGLFTEEFQIFIQLRLKEKLYHLYIDMDKQFWNDKETSDLFNELSDVLNEFDLKYPLKIGYHYAGINKSEYKLLE